MHVCVCVWCVRAYARLRESRACPRVYSQQGVLKTGLRVIPVKVECEYHKKGRGQITATAKYTLPADKKDAVVPYTTLLRKALSTCLPPSSPIPHNCRALHHPLDFDLLYALAPNPTPPSLQDPLYPLLSTPCSLHGNLPRM